MVDTNIIIDYTKGVKEKLEESLKKQNDHLLEFYVNPIIITEFFNDKSLKNKKKLNLALEFVENFQIVNIDKETAMIASELLRENKVNFLADAMIDVTCLQYSFYLYTNNKTDFKKVKGLKFYKD